jgi:hypothetical protein
MQNGLVWVETRHDESSNMQRLELYCYTGSAWEHQADITFFAKSSGGTTEEMDDLPSVTPLYNHFNRKRMKLTYPSTSTNGYNVVANVEMYYGKPFILIQCEAYGLEETTAPELEEIEYSLININSRYDFFTNGIDGELDATSGDQTGTAVADADTDNFLYLHTESTLTTGTRVLGFGRINQDDCDYEYNDAGSYFDQVDVAFDNRTIDGTTSAPLIVVYAYVYDNVGSKNPETTMKEFLVDIDDWEDLLEVRNPNYI